MESSSPPLYSGYVPASGYFSAPPDVYFSGDFTITAWTLVYSIQAWSRILDFGSGYPMNNVFIALSDYISGNPVGAIYNYTSYINYLCNTSIVLHLHWTHVAMVANGTTAYLYINGSFVAQSIQYVAPNVVRTNNYIGKSSWPGDSLANATYKNIRIYNKALNGLAIINDMQN